MKLNNEKYVAKRTFNGSKVEQKRRFVNFASGASFDASLLLDALVAKLLGTD